MNCNTKNRVIKITNKIKENDIDKLREILNKERHNLHLIILIEFKEKLISRAVYSFLRHQKMYENITLYLSEDNYIFMRELGLVDILNIKMLEEWTKI